MTYKQAMKKMAGIAKKRYHHVDYRVTTQSDGKQVQECALYIAADQPTLVHASTWAEAFALLDEELTGKSRLEDVGNVSEIEQSELGGDNER